jgi:hypothetical protein
MTKQERMAGLVFAMFGLAISIYSLTALKIGNISQPGPGLFPLICGVGIILLCLLWLFRNRNACNTSEPLWSGGNWFRPALAVVIMVAYAALMEDLGYVLSTLLFLIIWQKLVEGEKWQKTAIITVAGTVAMYILFVYLLKVALPEGMLGI